MRAGKSLGIIGASPCSSSLASVRAAPRQGVLRGRQGRRGFTQGPAQTHSAAQPTHAPARHAPAAHVATDLHSLAPVLFVATLVLGWLAARLYPLQWPGIDDLPARLIGYGLGAAGIALMAWGLATLARAGTTMLPNKGADRLVTEGPFRYRRNPIYMGEVLILLGLAQLTLNIWLAILGARLRARRLQACHQGRGAASGGTLRAGVPRLQGAHAALVLRRGAWPRTIAQMNVERNASSWRASRPAPGAILPSGWRPSPPRASARPATRTRSSTG